jgi:hypothetical protein
VFSILTRKAAGALATRLSLRPLIEGKNDQSSGRVCRENAKLYPDVIPGRCASIELWCTIVHLRIHWAAVLLGGMDSGLASSMRPGMTAEGMDAVFESLCTAARPAFTTLLTGNGVSAAFSVKVRDVTRRPGSAANLARSPSKASGRKHA